METSVKEPGHRRARSGGHRLLGQLAWVSSGRIAAALLQAVSLVLAARALEVADFGYLTSFIGLVTIIQVLVDCGVGTFITRERAARPESGAVTSALRFTFLSSAMMVGLIVVGLVLAALLVSSKFWSLLPLAAWAAAERNADTRLSVAFADGDVHVSVLNLVVRRAATIALFVTAVQLDVSALWAFSLASAASALGSATFANLYVRRRVTAPSSLSLAELLRRARPYWVASIASQARNLDATLVTAFAGAGQAGLYSSGSRLVNPLQILPSSLASILLPASARAEASRGVLLRLIKLAFVVVAGLSVVYAAVFLAAPVLVREALGTRYDGSATVIRIILLGMPFASFSALFTSILQGRDRGREVAISSTLATLSCLVGVCLVVPFAGARGAATVLSVSFVVQSLVLARSLHKLWLRSA